MVAPTAGGGFGLVEASLGGESDLSGPGGVGRTQPSATLGQRDHARIITAGDYGAGTQADGWLIRLRRGVSSSEFGW